MDRHKNVQTQRAKLHRLFPADAGVRGGRHGLECAPVTLARNTRAGPEEDVI